MILTHFFNLGWSVGDMRNHLMLLEGSMNQRGKAVAESIIQRASQSFYYQGAATEFLFGVDVDAALESFFAMDSIDKKVLILFWSPFGTGNGSKD